MGSYLRLRVPVASSRKRLIEVRLNEEWMDVMMELKLTLGFVCCGCEECVTVTVQCRGEMLRDHDLPAVKVPCPTCGTINQLSFETNGTVRSVRPCVCYRPLPQPSLN